MRTFREEIDTSLSQILSADQMESYKESSGSNTGRGRFFGGGGGGDNGGGGRGGRGGG